MKHSHAMRKLVDTKRVLFENMKKLNNDFIINENYLQEAPVGGTLENFFDFLEKNPKAGSIAYLYYTYPVSMNKNLEGRGKNAVPNPMYNREFDHSIIFKSIWYSFNFGYTFDKAMLKVNPEYTPTERNYTLTKHPDLRYVESGPKGDYINIIPIKTGKSVYAMFDETKGLDGLKDVNNYRIISDFKEIEQYFPTRSDYQGQVDYRKFFVTRIYQIAAGTYLFNNGEFKYVYFGEQPNRG